MTSEDKRRALPALFVSMMCTTLPVAVLSLLLVEISLSLGTPISLTGQLLTVISITALFGSLMATGLTSRFSYRNLLIAGLAIIAASSIASAFSLSFMVLLGFTVTAGLGIAVATPTTTTLVGEYYQREERGRVMGLIGIAAAASFLVGGVVVGVLAQVGGWRLAYLGFAGVLGVLGLASTTMLLPKSKFRGSGGSIIVNVRRVAGNRGAMRSLGGALLCSTAEMGLNLYCFSFLKEVYAAGTVLTGIVFTGSAASYIVGSFASSRLIGGLGPRRTTIVGMLGISAATLAYHFLPGLALSVAAVMAGNFVMGFRLSGNSALSLDQSSKQGGAVMSLHFASTQLGYSAGTALGGLMLAYSGWSLMGVVLPVLGLCGLLMVALIREDHVG